MVILLAMTEIPSIAVRLGMRHLRHAERAALLAKMRNATMEMCVLDILLAMIRVRSFVGHPSMTLLQHARRPVAQQPIVRLAKPVFPSLLATLQKQTCLLSHSTVAQHLRRHLCRAPPLVRVESTVTVLTMSYVIHTHRVLNAIHISVVWHGLMLLRAATNLALQVHHPSAPMTNFAFPPHLVTKQSLFIAEWHLKTLQQHVEFHVPMVKVARAPSIKAASLTLCAKKMGTVPSSRPRLHRSPKLHSILTTVEHLMTKHPQNVGFLVRLKHHLSVPMVKLVLRLHHVQIKNHFFVAIHGKKHHLLAKSHAKQILIVIKVIAALDTLLARRLKHFSVELPSMKLLQNVATHVPLEKISTVKMVRNASSTLHVEIFIRQMTMTVKNR
jgi:hypothetical protein